MVTAAANVEFCVSVGRVTRTAGSLTQSVKKCWLLKLSQPSDRLGFIYASLSPIYTADADETKLSSLVASASAVCVIGFNPR